MSNHPAYHIAIREHGSCRGCLWKQQVQGVSQSPRSSRDAASPDETRRTFEYCVLSGVLFISFADYTSYRRGDHPINILKIVGASAFSTSSLVSEVSSPSTSFRMVTSQGTHIYCTAPTPSDCSAWLASLHAGLEASYTSSSSELPVLKPPSAQKKSKRGIFREKQIPCTSCGRASEIITLATPLPQYGYETRCHVCPECLVSQGVWLEVNFRNQLYASHQYEENAFNEGKKECMKIIEGQTSLREIEVFEAPTTISHANALRDLISSPAFGAYRRMCPKLDKSCSELELGQLDVIEFVDLLNDTPDTEIAELKKQAFRVAGDMGSAMKLLAEYCCSGDIEMFKHILEFFLDLCEEGDLSSVAFFWPQLQCLHLKMLPPKDYNELLRVELMEDFLLSVSIMHSVQLGLELVWGYVADLEDSLFHTSISPSTRRRRFSVLRFVCELESLLFDFPHGWGGGSVSLRNMLTPSPHQVVMLREAMLQLGNHRRALAANFLSRSVRMDKLLHAKFAKPPEEAAEDALKAAKYADYFSSHMSFVRRICDVAEKLRFLEIDDRAFTLQKDMDSLNASGAMGGDPLNRVSNRLMRVVRVPSTEGHVFRSKERTPILLLMEIVEEGDPQVTEAMGIDDRLREQSERDIRKNGPSEEEANNRRATHYVVDLEMPSDLNDSIGSGRVSGLVDKADSESECEKELNVLPPEANMVAKEQVYDFPRGAVDSKTDSVFVVDERVGQGHAGMVADQSPDLIHKSPRALGKFKRFEGNPDGKEEIDVHREIKTPTKIAMEQLVTDVMIQQLDIPHLDETQEESGATVESIPNLPPARLNKALMSRKMTALGDIDAATLLGSEDIRRNVLTMIMSKGMKRSHAIAAGAAVAAQKSLQELDRKRAVDLILNGEVSPKDNSLLPPGSEEREREKAELQRQNLINLCVVGGTQDAESNFLDSQNEEDEAIESLRLLLIQNQKANGGSTNFNMTSLRNINAPIRRDGTIDKSEIIEIDAGDVDYRLKGCGTLPPAVLSALTLWKGGVVTTAELLELVKKDLQYIQQADNPSSEAQQDNSAFWGRFAFGERWAEKKARIAATSPEGSMAGWDLQGVIVKSNDDLRQEAFVMQLIELCREAFDMAGLELWVHPYRILATGRTTGIIECVKNAMSFDALKKRRGYRDGLRGHLKRMAEFSPNPGEAFNAMQHNFVRSLASYSLMSFMFLFKDRHNGNILLDTAGHVIHIDFGFVFGIAPGGSFSLELSTPFKITEEMLEVMGGIQSPFFSEFVTLFCCGFLALRAHMDTFLTIVEITCNSSSFKCFEGRETTEVVAKLRTRFCPDLSEEAAVAFALDLIKQATQSYGTKQYDLFQYLSQGIAA